MVIKETGEVCKHCGFERWSHLPLDRGDGVAVAYTKCPDPAVGGVFTEENRNKLFISPTGFENDSTEDIEHDLKTRENAPPHAREQHLMAKMREELNRRKLKEDIALLPSPTMNLQRGLKRLNYIAWHHATRPSAGSIGASVDLHRAERRKIAQRLIKARKENPAGVRDFIKRLSARRTGLKENQINEEYGEPYTDQNEMIKEIARRYGGSNLHAKHFSDHPPSTVYFHYKTGFPVASWRHDTKSGSIHPEHEFHKKLRLNEATSKMTELENKKTCPECKGKKTYHYIEKGQIKKAPCPTCAHVREDTLDEATYRIKGTSQTFDPNDTNADYLHGKWHVDNDDFDVRAVSRKHALSKALKKLSQKYPHHKEHEAKIDEENTYPHSGFSDLTRHGWKYTGTRWEHPDFPGHHIHTSVRSFMHRVNVAHMDKKRWEETIGVGERADIGSHLDKFHRTAGFNEETLNEDSGVSKLALRKHGWETFGNGLWTNQEGYSHGHIKLLNTKHGGISWKHGYGEKQLASGHTEDSLLSHLNWYHKSRPLPLHADKMINPFDVREETLNELSPDTLSSYVNKAGLDIRHLKTMSKYGGITRTLRSGIKKAILKREGGIEKAASKEDFPRMYSKYTLHNYVDRKHVSTPDETIARGIRMKFSHLPEHHKKIAVADALKRHHANREEYRMVMSGKF